MKLNILVLQKNTDPPADIKPIGTVAGISEIRLTREDYRTGQSLQSQIFDNSPLGHILAVLLYLIVLFLFFMIAFIIYVIIGSTVYYFGPERVRERKERRPKINALNEFAQACQLPRLNKLGNYSGQKKKGNGEFKGEFFSSLAFQFINNPFYFENHLQLLLNSSLMEECVEYNRKLKTTRPDESMLIEPPGEIENFYCFQDSIKNSDHIRQAQAMVKDFLGFMEWKNVYKSLECPQKPDSDGMRVSTAQEGKETFDADEAP